jgi:hypothetical protein
MNKDLNNSDFAAPARDTAAGLNASDIAQSSLRMGRRALAWGLIYLMIPMGVADMFAQEAPPPPPPDYQDQGQPAPPDYQGQVAPPQAYSW